MEKLSLILILILCLVIISLLFIVAKAQGIWPFKETYQAVALTSGEIYYGKLSFFPSPRLKDAWFVRQEPAKEEGKEPNLMLSPVSALYFAPKNVLYLKKENILWWADLSDQSQVLNLIKSRGKGQEIQTPQVPSTLAPEKPTK